MFKALSRVSLPWNQDKVSRELSTACQERNPAGFLLVCECTGTTEVRLARKHWFSTKTRGSSMYHLCLL